MAFGCADAASDRPASFGAEVWPAPFKLAQVVDYHDFKLVFDGGQFLELLHEPPVGKGGNGGGDRRVRSRSIHAANIMPENK